MAKKKWVAGQHVVYCENELSRFEGDRIVESWGEADVASIRRQLEAPSARPELVAHD